MPPRPSSPPPRVSSPPRGSSPSRLGTLLSPRRGNSPPRERKSTVSGGGGDEPSRRASSDAAGGRSPGGPGGVDSLADLASQFEVVIHSIMHKRGKMKWNKRYMVLIRPIPGASKLALKHLNPVGSMYYFKNAKQFVAQASRGGATSVDVARLFAPPAPGKEVPKELALAGCHVEPRSDKWPTPSGTFGFLVVDEKGVDYPFATDSGTLRDLWVNALDSTIHAAEAREEEAEFARRQAAADAAFSGGGPGSPSGPPRMPPRPPPGSAGKPPAHPGAPTGAGRAGQLKKPSVANLSLFQTGAVKVPRSPLLPEGPQTVDLAAALKLLNTRSFLGSRRDMELLMRELLSHGLGDPGGASRIIGETVARLGASDGEALVKGFMSRCVELLSLEPIDSPSTSRVVACTCAILASFARGHAGAHKALATYPLLGELGFELHALVAKSEHPGLLDQAASLVAVVLGPASLPTRPDAAALTFAPTPNGAAVACGLEGPARARRGGGGVVTVDLGDDDLEDLAGPAADANDMGGLGYLAFLKGGTNPLWPVVFGLANASAEAPRVAALTVLAGMSEEPEVAVAICSAHEAKPPVDRKAAASPPASSRDSRHSRGSRGGGLGGSAGSDDKDEFGMDEVFSGLGSGGASLLASMPLVRTGRSSSVGVKFSTGNPMAGASPGRAGLVSVPRGGLNVHGALAHTASSPGMVGSPGGVTSPAGSARGGLVLDTMAEGEYDDDGGGGGGNGSGKGGGKGSARRAPIVAQVLATLSGEAGEATRPLAIAFLENLLVHAQAVAGAEPILRAVCTPELIAAAEALASIHAKATRHYAEAITEAKLAAGKALPPLPPPSPVAAPLGRSRNMSVTYEDSGGLGRAAAAREGPVSLQKSAQAAGALEVARGCALCLWHIGCILTYHPATAKSQGVKPGQSFAAFEKKLLGQEMTY